MIKKQRTTVFLFGIVMLLTLACRFGTDLPWNAGEQDVPISAEDVAEAATRAAEAAAAAGVSTDQLGEIAATAVAQGSDIVATAEALPTPDLGAAVGATALEQKLANIQPDANGNFTVDITEEDLNEFVSGQSGGGIQTEGLNVENVQIGITDESVKLTGDVKQPLELPLTVELRPSVLNSQLQFEIISASAGFFPVPDAMLDLIEATANSELTQALTGLPANVTLTDAQLGNGVLMIMGQQN